MNMERFIQSNRIHMDIHKGDTDGSSETARQRKRYTQTLRCTQTHGRDTCRPLETPRDTQKETVRPSDIARPTRGKHSRTLPHTWTNMGKIQTHLEKITQMDKYGQGLCSMLDEKKKI